MISGVCPAHRDEVFSALSFAVQRLKEFVPIRKKEVKERGAQWKSEACWK